MPKRFQYLSPKEREVYIDVLDRLEREGRGKGDAQFEKVRSWIAHMGD